MAYQCLEGLEPRRVFEIFGNLCQIPRGSKNEKAVSDYVYEFCHRLGLEVYQDEKWNLIIKKPATPGYENVPVVILQAHLDMVCEKNADKIHDFKKDPIPVKRDGDRIYGDGTTLGADDGTGIAFAMCVLESRDIPHPALEVVLTADEEAGMSGIRALDFSKLKGRVIINLDCSDEGIVVGCAGVVSVCMKLQMEREAIPGNWERAKMRVCGLIGGHSGLDITKERGNANVILGRILSELRREVGIRLVSFEGGMQTNAICREAEAEIAFAASEAGVLKRKLVDWEKALKKELKISDPGIHLILREEGESWGAFSDRDTERFLGLLMNIDCGVIAMNVQIQGLAETSGNIGFVRAGGKEAVIRILYRSCYDSKKQYVIDKIRWLAMLAGAEFSIESDSPEWEYKEDNALSLLIQKIYKERFGKPLVVEVSHGGNECGAFFRQFPDADIVCTGTQIFGAHSPGESVLVSTVQKEWEMLCLTLERMKEYRH